MVLTAISKRRAVRKFKPDPVPENMIDEIITAAQYAPTSRNNRATEFIVVQDPAIRLKVYEAAEPHQDFVREAPLIIVPVANPEKTNNPVQDLSLATGHILLQAADLQLGGVWKNLKPDSARAVRDALGIPQNCTIINCIPIGFPSGQPDPHTKSECTPARIHRDRW
ncbi:MAG: nitroreductase family protein [Patescibacteria group bacterium]